MIEKIMKVVKSGNKKRGRNITIGTVVGMLLSCTTVMGTGLNITKEIGTDIKFSNAGTELFKENSFKNNIYTNNTKIDGIYLKIANDLKIDLYNNGTILGRESGSYKIGLWLNSTTMGNIENDGMITGDNNAGQYGYGIYGISSTIDNIKNNGIISGITNSYGYGIFISSSSTEIQNTGLIIATEINYSGTPVVSTAAIINKNSKVNRVDNKGTLFGSANNRNNSYGISNVRTTTNEINNTGSIFVNSEENSTGYGISTENGKIKTIGNYGLIFTNKENSNGKTGYGIFNMGDFEDEGKIVNEGSIIGNGKNEGTGINN